MLGLLTKRVLVRIRVGIKIMVNLMGPYLIRGKHKFHQKAAGGSEASGEGVTDPMICFKCGGLGHCASEFKNTRLSCFKCGKQGHHVIEYQSAILTCFNCGEPGHIRTQCQKSNKAQASGKVFSLSGVENSKSDNLIRGTCFTKGVSFIVIIDMVATHSFISLDCIKS